MEVVLVAWLVTGFAVWVFHFLESDPITQPGLIELVLFLLAGPLSLTTVFK